MTKAVVYRFFNKKNELMYVGSTTDWQLRQIEHQKNSWWYKFVVAYKLEKLESLAASRILEADIIKSEYPKYNVQHNTSNSSGWEGGTDYDGPIALPPDWNKSRRQLLAEGKRPGANFYIPNHGITPKIKKQRDEQRRNLKRVKRGK